MWFTDHDLVNLETLPGTDPALPAQSWARLTGDAGSAALLLSGEREPSRRVLRHAAGQEGLLLHLFRESSTLLALPDAWRTEFITCLQPGDSAATFFWSGLRANSPMEGSASGSLLDLANPASIPPAPENAAAQFARGGVAPPPPGLLGDGTRSSPSYEDLYKPTQSRFSRRATEDPPPAKSQTWQWIAAAIFVVSCLSVLGWKLMFGDDGNIVPRRRAQASDLPQNPATLMNTGRNSASDEATMHTIEQLAANEHFLEALEHWKTLAASAPAYADAHAELLKSRLIPGAQKEWLQNLDALVNRLAQGPAGRAGLADALMVLRDFPRSWPVSDPVGLQNAWNSAMAVQKIVDRLPEGPIWVVDNFANAAAGEGYRDFSATFAIPELFTLLGNRDLKLRAAAAPADSLLLPAPAEWFQFDLRNGDFGAGDYLILHDASRGSAGGRFLQLFLENGGKLRLVWRVFGAGSEFFQKFPANGPLNSPMGQMWLRVEAGGRPPLYLLLRRPEGSGDAPWSSILGRYSWLAVDGAPASVSLPKWLTANLQLKPQPGQAFQLSPNGGGNIVAQSLLTSQAKTQAAAGVIQYQASWYISALDDQIRAAQVLQAQTRQKLTEGQAELKNASNNPTGQAAIDRLRKSVDKLQQDIAQMQTAGTAALEARWPASAAPWSLVYQRDPEHSVTLMEFRPDETRPTH